MTDSQNFSDFLRDYERQQAERREAAQIVLRQLCDELAPLGIDRVVVEYDGYGDSQNYENVVAYHGDEIVELRDDLGQRLIAATDEHLPGGWENNEGAFGQLVLDVAARTLTRQHNRRVESSEYDEEVFPL